MSDKLKKLGYKALVSDGPEGDAAALAFFKTAKDSDIATTDALSKALLQSQDEEGKPIRYCMYKDKRYILVWSGRTKFGLKSKLKFTNGDKEFWADSAKVTVEGEVGTGGQVVTPAAQPAGNDEPPF